MFRSYFKIGWRNLFKEKGYSFINIGGLAAGMAVAVLIGLWIYDELSFNKYHKNYDSIARVMYRVIRQWGNRPFESYAVSLRSRVGRKFSK